MKKKKRKGTKGRKRKKSVNKGYSRKENMRTRKKTVIRKRESLGFKTETQVEME